MTFSNVVRWGALTAGALYGFLHNRTLANAAVEHREVAALRKKEKLIAEAKSKWLQLHPKPAASSDGPVTDVDSPDFDPVKVIDWQIKQLDA